MNLRLPVTVALFAVAISGGTVIAQSSRTDTVRNRIVERVRERVDRIHDAIDRVHDRVGHHVRNRVVHRLEERHELRLRQPGASNSDPCSDRGWDDNYFRHCEVRQQTLPPAPLTVDAGRNGGIRVEGWDRNEIAIQSIVTAHSRSEQRSKEIASGIQIQAGGGRVTAIGPDTDGREWWSVSFRINVPRKSDLDLKASNGGITIADVAGNIRFDTTNGGVRLSDLAGFVRGETRNGGLTVTLSGSRWDGEGLDVQTSNGGVTLAIPENYNAMLETRTVNGGFRFDYPMTVQGELSPRRGLTTTLGSGGAPVRVRTTNGGLTIRRR